MCGYSIARLKEILICVIIIIMEMVSYFVLYVYYNYVYFHNSYHVTLSQLMQDKEFGETALIAASYRGHIKCATVLLKHGADVNYQRKVRLLYVE